MHHFLFDAGTDQTRPDKADRAVPNGVPVVDLVQSSWFYFP
jgi:hypothetical protein